MSYQVRIGQLFNKVEGVGGGGKIPHPTPRSQRLSFRWFFCERRRRGRNILLWFPPEIKQFFIDRWKRWKRRRWLKSFESLTSLSKMPAEVGCAVSHNDLSGVCIVPTELLEAVNIMAEKLLPTIVICSSYPAKQLFYLLCLLTIENCQLHRSDVNWEKDAVNRAQIFKRCLSG